MAVDPAHPFPALLNANLYIAVRLKGTGRPPHPRRQARLCPGARGAQPRSSTFRRPAARARYVFLEDVIRENIATLFEGYEILSAHPLRVTRDADLTIDEEGAEDLLKAIEYELRRRPRGAAVGSR